MLMVSDLRHELEQMKSNMNSNGGRTSATQRIESVPSVSINNIFQSVIRKTIIGGKTQIQFYCFAFQYDLKQHLAWEKRMRASNLARNNIMLQRRNSINSG